MFWKLVACLLAIGVMGCSLLAMRQARLQAAHELAQTQLRIRACDERLFKLRTQIGAMVRPEDVKSLVAGMAALKPLTPPPIAAAKSGAQSADQTSEDPAKPDPAAKQNSPKNKPKAAPAESRPRVRSVRPSTDEAKGPDQDGDAALYALDDVGEEDQ